MSASGSNQNPLLSTAAATQFAQVLAIEAFNDLISSVSSCLVSEHSAESQAKAFWLIFRFHNLIKASPTLLFYLSQLTPYIHKLGLIFLRSREKTQALLHLFNQQSPLTSGLESMRDILQARMEEFALRGITEGAPSPAVELAQLQQANSEEVELLYTQISNLLTVEEPWTEELNLFSLVRLQLERFDLTRMRRFSFSSMATPEPAVLYQAYLAALDNIFIPANLTRAFLFSFLLQMKLVVPLIVQADQEQLIVDALNVLQSQIAPVLAFLQPRGPEIAQPSSTQTSSNFFPSAPHEQPFDVAISPPANPNVEFEQAGSGPELGPGLGPELDSEPEANSPSHYFRF